MPPKVEIVLKPFRDPRAVAEEFAAIVERGEKPSKALCVALSDIASEAVEHPAVVKKITKRWERLVWAMVFDFLQAQGISKREAGRILHELTESDYNLASGRSVEKAVDRIRASFTTETESS